MLGLAIETQPGDYVKDGLIHCGKCETPKQFMIPLDIEPDRRLVPIMCKCMQEDKKRREREFAEIQRQADIDIALSVGLTSEKYRTMTFEKSDGTVPQAENYVKYWPKMRDENIGLMLIGDTGTGKTYAAACIANALIRKGVRAYMANVTTISDIMSCMYSADREQLMQTVKRCDLLIIDDFGAQRSSDFVNEQMYNLLETRIGTLKPLIITSNLTMAELRQTQDTQLKRMYDRLKEACHPVEMKGDSRRRKIANNRYKVTESILSKGGS